MSNDSDEPGTSDVPGTEDTPEAATTSGDKTPAKDAAGDRSKTDDEGKASAPSDEPTDSDESTAVEEPTSSDEPSTSGPKDKKRSRWIDRDPDPDADDADDATTKRSRLVLVAAAVLCVVGLVAVTVTGINYWNAHQEQQRSEARDRLIDDASRLVVSSMTFSATTFDADMNQLKDESTGSFLDQQVAYGEQIRQAIVQADARTDAAVSNIAVIDMDSDAGNATLLAIYTAHWYKSDELVAAGRQAARLTLVRDDRKAPWKLSELVPVGPQVPVGPSSSSVQQLDQAQVGGQTKKDEKDEKKPAPSGSATSSATSTSAPAKPGAATSTSTPAKPGAVSSKTPATGGN